MTHTERVMTEAAADYLEQVNGAPIGKRDYALAFLAGLYAGEAGSKSERDIWDAIDRANAAIRGEGQRT